jgi:glycosyltransferase involved in cell wall biosynthesis
MITISTQVKKRIKDVYNRETDIIFPPVDTQKFAKWSNGVIKNGLIQNDYYLTVSRLVPYKHVDFLVKLFNRTQKNLVIVGVGSEFKRLQKMAGPTVHLIGGVIDEELVSYYQHCQAFVQANEEDFGISMVEAQAAGKPVVALGVGGAVDIVQDGLTGILVQSSALTEWETALTKCERIKFSADMCRQSADRFSQDKWRKQITSKLKKYGLK